MSGGPDSLALLLLAHAAMPDRIEAVTVDHGLRAESADEAAMVAGLCSELGVAHEALVVTVASGNLQSAARKARYEALALWVKRRRLAGVMTAHHADDQAETLLMRLNRGSGLSGLAGVRPVNRLPDDAGHIVRPLIGWRKTELERIVADADIVPARDPSNEDDRFDRARIRKVIAEADWLNVEAVARSAAWLESAETTLRFYVEREWDGYVSQVGDEIAYANRVSTPREIKLRLLGRAIRALGGEPRGSQVAELLDALEAGKGGNVAGVLAKAVRGEWMLRREPPRR